MNKKRFYWILIGLFITLNTYLFVSAPPPLQEESKAQKRFSVEDVFRQLGQPYGIMTIWKRTNCCVALLTIAS